ncbi:hypothetical protein [Pseudogemmobacter blasticus]|uniref:hypothetical protein n=1 Tax=Fuscovulum blasticum TaxID=1075 RepID=UPI0015E67EDE|nr:hypothetical protein [Fuscovulum blasticum]
MTMPPLTRDQQIELMVNAAERHAAHAARWMSDRQVQTVVAAVPEDRQYTQDESTRALAKCA